jgi:hypothetical protein
VGVTENSNSVGDDLVLKNLLFPNGIIAPVSLTLIAKEGTNGN